MKRLIINADDLGFAPGVNRGILECHRAGSVTSASMMVNTPAFDEAAALARDTPTLDVGLHFNLLSGSPLTDVPTLANPRTGQFHSLAELARRAFAGRVAADDVRRECSAQLQALLHAGIAPTHIDSHRHTHALPGILKPVLQCASDVGVRFVRRPLDRLVMTDPIASAKMSILHAAWRLAVRGLTRAELRFVDDAPAFRGIALQGAVDLHSRLMALLDALPNGTTELMLHPGYDDSILAAQDPYRAEREREVAVLISAAVQSRLSRGDFELVNFAS